MPELPDIEGFKRYFARYASGKEVERTEVASAEMVRNRSARGLSSVVTGRCFGDPQRHGKWMTVPIGEGMRRLLFHFGMTGELTWNDEPRSHDRVTFHFSDGHLAYRNMRKLGGIWVADDDAEAREAVGTQGPDAMAVDRSALAERLQDRRGGIKATLMNQEVIAGIGNELSDEILWSARIDPKTKAHELSDDAVGALSEAMQRVLKESTKHGRIPRDEGRLTSQRRAEQPRCPRSHGALRRETIAGRTALWCPRCQTRP